MTVWVGFHRLAAQEARAAEAWYAPHSPDTARRFRTEVSAAAMRIADNVGTHAIPETKCRYVYVRRFPYRLIYSMDDKTALVVAVAHARRRPGYWRRRTHHP